MNLIELKKLIVDSATAYYSGNPIISDEQFDRLIDQLKEIDPKDYLLTTIGWGSQEISTDLIKVPHDIKFSRGFNKVKIDPHTVIDRSKYKTLKYDGASVTLYYNNDGYLYRAVTRNDGEFGFDVTSKLKYLVPTRINVPIHSITGEFILSKQCNEKFFNSNSPRNVAVGKLMSKSVDPSDIVKFDFVAYRIMSIYNTEEGQKLKEVFKEDRNQINDVLNSLGFRSAPILDSNFDYSTYEELFGILSELSNDLHTYMADGIVVDSGVKFNESEDSRLILVSYKDELAYKVKTEIATVTVKDVIWNHTRTGRYVPTVIYDEVNISGAKCSRATGHNAKFIKENNIGIGTTIEIVRSGEVIPYISDVIESTGYALPTHCDCGSELKWSGVDLVCNNPNCEYNQYNRLYNYIANVGAVKGVSGKIISAMIGFAGWEDISDIYKNPVRNWSGLSIMTGLGDSAVNLANKTANYLYNEIWYYCWIVGLGLNGIGSKTAKYIGAKLYNYLKNPDRLKSYWKFSDINGIGSSIEQTINFNKEYICELFDCVRDKLRFDIVGNKNEDNNNGNENSGLIKVCITGKLEFGTKSDFYEKFKNKIVESDVNNCDILICNKVGSSKYNKAIKLGKEIITEYQAVSKFGE